MKTKSISSSKATEHEQYRLRSWCSFNVVFWWLFIGSLIVIYCIDRLGAFAFGPLLSFLAFFAISLIVPIAMSLLLVRGAYGLRRSRKDVWLYVLLGLLPIGLGWVGGFTSWTGESASWWQGVGQIVRSWHELPMGRLGWVASFVPNAVIYLAAYVSLFFRYRRAKTALTRRSVGLPLAIAVVVLAVVYVLSPDVPAVTNKLVKAYFAVQPNVASYKVERTLWTHSCCMQVTKTTPLQANGVIYTLQVTFKNGSREREYITLRGSRDQAAQLYDDTGGHQEWKMGEVYKGGEVPPGGYYPH